MQFLRMFHLADNLAPWVSDWLTPVWLLGVGAALGLLVLSILLGIGCLLSRIPQVGSLHENAKHRWMAVSILSAVFLVLSIPFVIMPAVRSAGTGENATWDFEVLGLSICIAIPVCIGLALVGVSLVSRRTLSEIQLTMREGVMRYILILTSILAAFGVLGTSLVQNPGEILGSIPRFAHSGRNINDHEVRLLPVGTTQEQTVEIDPFDVVEVIQIQIVSSEPMEVLFPSIKGENNVEAVRLVADEPFFWSIADQFAIVLPEGTISSFAVRNQGNKSAKLQVTVDTRAKYPEVRTIFITAGSVVALFLLYLLQSTAMPRVSAIALSTTKSETAQPMFAMMLSLGTFLLILFIWIPYFTFGEDIKMLKNSGLALIMVLCIIQAIWAAGVSISEEVEGRTALTVLSKPIARHSFILGKFLGIVWTVGLMFLVLGTVFLLVVSAKAIYDGMESSQSEISWQVCHLEMIQVVPGLALAFLETVVLTAISVAISTRMPMLANFSIVGSIYVLGHLTPLIVQSSNLGAFGMVRFFGQLVATIFPNLESFNIQAAVAGGTPVPYVYLGWSLIYCILFSGIAMLLALVLFEDRDMA